MIPLTKFNTRINGNGQVVTQVNRSSAAESLAHSFQARMGEHWGIYERIGLSRFPVEERYGPATAQMMYSNAEPTCKKSVISWKNCVTIWTPFGMMKQMLSQIWKGLAWSTRIIISRQNKPAAAWTKR